MDAAKSTERVQFEAWMRSSGFVWSPADVAFDAVRSAGFGVVARRALPAGHTLVSFPKASVLTSRTSALARALEEARLGGLGALTLALTHERRLGDASRWAPYLRTLPRCEPLPVLWPADALSRLAGTALPAATAHALATWRADWEAVPAKLRGAAGAESWDDYLHARTLVSSRSFAVDAYHGDGMVPFADAFNHAREEHVHFTGAGEACACCGGPEPDDTEAHEEEASAGGGGGGEAVGAEDTARALSGLPPLRPPAGTKCPLCGAVVVGDGPCDAPSPPDTSDGLHSLSMVVCRSVQPGEEVCNTFGDLSSGQLLLRYGFTLPPAVASAVPDPFAAVCLSHALVRATLASQPAMSALRPPLDARLAVAASAGLISLTLDGGAGASGSSEEDEYCFAIADPVLFDRDLLLLLNLVSCSPRVFKAASRALATAEDDDDAEPPPAILWGCFAAAAEGAEGMGEGKRDEEGGEEGKEGEEEEGEEEEEEEEETAEGVAFLLPYPVRALLRACLAARRCLYPPSVSAPGGAARMGAAEEAARVEADAAAAAEEEEACQPGAGAAAALHCLRIVASEVSALDAAAARLDAMDAGDSAAVAAPAAGAAAASAASAGAAGVRGVKRAVGDDAAWSVFE